MASPLDGITKDYDGPRSTGTLWPLVEGRSWEKDPRVYDAGFKRCLRYHYTRVKKEEAESAGYRWARINIWPQDVKLVERIIKEMCSMQPFLMFDHRNKDRPKLYQFCYGVHRRILEIYDGHF